MPPSEDQELIAELLAAIKQYRQYLGECVCLKGFEGKDPDCEFHESESVAKALDAVIAKAEAKLTRESRK